MKTTIEFKDGHTEVVEDGVPNVYENSVVILDDECSALTDDVSLDLIARIIFEND